MAKQQAVPVTVVSGFKGAGKTTLINHLKAGLRGKSVAVLEDDGEKDLFQEIEDAVAVRGADAIVIECLANLEPYFVAEHLLFGDDETPPPHGIRVDTLVTVVDASSFIDEIRESADLQDRDLAFDDDDDRMVPELLIEQVEFANVIVINKTDRVGPEEVAEVEALLRRLNPLAQLIKTERGRASAHDLVDTKLFDFERTDNGVGWLAELSGEFAESKTENGVSSFTYVERRPFHPIRFNEFLSELEIDGVVRAKGSVWVATRHNEIGIWSLAGKASILTYGGAWFAATPAREWPSEAIERAEIMREWTPPFGDRRQEIAFIGLNMNEVDLRERLRDCLLTSAEMKDGPESWYSIPDPLPDWHEDTDPESYGSPDTLI